MIDKFKKFLSYLKREDKNKVFIAMWMDDKHQPLNTAIKEALKRAGYEGYRIDDISHNKQITEEIFRRIKKSPFVVADFTHGKDGPRGSVFYEAGYARGAGIEVIHTCKNSVLNKQRLSFDTSQFPHITWKNLTKESMKEFVSKLSEHVVESRGRRIKKPKPKPEKTKGTIVWAGEGNSRQAFLVYTDSKGEIIAQKIFVS